MVYHALNRANFRSRLFKKQSHYQDFLGLLGGERVSGTLFLGRLGPGLGLATPLAA
jgi:hypothetical protein